MRWHVHLGIAKFAAGYYPDMDVGQNSALAKLVLI